MSRERTRGQRVLTQMDIEGMILDDNDLLEEATDAYGDLLEAEAAAQNKYKDVFNSAYFSMSTGGHDIRKTYAEREAQDERAEYVITQAQVAAQKEVMWTIRTRIESIRSLNANVRSQV